MDNYQGFSNVYDTLMADVDYDGWFHYLEAVWKKYNKKPQLVLDLGCGTGAMSMRLDSSGYDVIGLDYSADMLMIAQQKAAGLGRDILFLNQDMTAFELYGTVDSIISLCDCINYIDKDDALMQCFSLVHNYLNPGGLFLFDVNTVYKYEQLLSDFTYAENLDTVSYILENYYDTSTALHEYLLTLFVKNGTGSFHKLQEVHCQRAYTQKMLTDFLTDAGLKLVGVFDAYTWQPPKKTSERLFFAAEKPK